MRQRSLDGARRVLGQAIGRCPGKEKLFKVGRPLHAVDQLISPSRDAHQPHASRTPTQGYIALELQLGEVERCRKLYAKYLEAMPYNCQVGNQRRFTIRGIDMCVCVRVYLHMYVHM